MMERNRWKHISLRVPRELDRWLRIEAAKQDVSKSALIRGFLSHSALLAAEPDGGHETPKGAERMTTLEQETTGEH